MREIETDYLVIGAGASGMAFTDSLLTGSDADFVIVDRRHRPGGHWLDAYPFVRLHQPSANYGVNSRQLGQNRIDESGPNAGFYERATAPEICDYFGRVLDDFVASGRVRFYGMSDYRGEDADGHHVVSLLTGAETVIRARTLVDATYVESSIPSRHTPSFEIDDGVRVIPPNDLVDLVDAPSGFSVLGAGKTAMDTCIWLLDAGVAPDRIQWVKPRDGWFFNRKFMQPLDLVGSYMQMQGRWLEASANAVDGHGMARHLEERDVFVRIDPTVEADMWRGAIVSEHELEALRSIERVVRMGKVRRVGSKRVVLDQGEAPIEANQLYVDCTAAGVRRTPTRPVFEPGRITLQYVTIGFTPWSAASVGAVEALGRDLEDKNRLCPPLVFTGSVADMPRIAFDGIGGLMARGADPEFAAWSRGCRLDPTQAASTHATDPAVADGFALMGANLGRALENLERIAP